MMVRCRYLQTCFGFVLFFVVEKKCEPNPCQNSGICRELMEEEDYKCECLHEYRGKDCEGLPVVITTCLCYRTKSVSSIMTFFPCFFSFLEEINLCESNPCINGGTCSQLGSSYHCLCVEGFRGLNCQGTCTISKRFDFLSE